MRQIYALGLCAVAGCAVDGRPAEPGMPDVTGGDIDQVDPPPVGRLIPDVCDQRTWTVTPDDKDLDVAVVPIDGGAAVFAVPRAGGPVRGFRVDARGDLVGTQETLLDDRAYTHVAASRAGGRLVIAALADDKVTLDVVRDDLGARFALGDYEGTLVSAQPMATLRDQQLSLIGGAGGVSAIGFAGSLWTQTEPLVLTKSPVVAVDAVPYGDQVMVAWSTADKECHLQRIGSGLESTRAFGCDGVRLAADPVAQRATLVYEQAGTIQRIAIRVGDAGELATTQQVALQAAAPRVGFDGVRTWVAFLDVHGDVVVGFIDEHDRLVSRGLAGTQPRRDAYQLAVFGGAPWIVMAGDAGFGAQRLCAVPE